MVTHFTTNLSISSLTRAERTGSRIFWIPWPNALWETLPEIYSYQKPSWFGQSAPHFYERTFWRDSFLALLLQLLKHLRAVHHSATLGKSFARSILRPCTTVSAYCRPKPRGIQALGHIAHVQLQGSRVHTQSQDYRRSSTKIKDASSIMCTALAS